MLIIVEEMTPNEVRTKYDVAVVLGNDLDTY